VLLVRILVINRNDNVVQTLHTVIFRRLNSCLEGYFSLFIFLINFNINLVKIIDVLGK
jgi:hypothetical protein